ncbi:YgjV family protein [Treponema zioleckii]|uniref:YgjV family protein n=1 Tax=Treponema zioleckii TaxID=331680 RepID=UPI00168BD7DD|nr:YgjV family protein [Treponema zioleckii]
MNFIELFGYLGSFLVILSMLMNSMTKLRIINTAGCIICVIYALIIKSYPVAVMNGALAIINIVKLVLRKQ